LIPAHAYWGDESYDPEPSIFDLDKDAHFDSFELLTRAVFNSAKLTVNRENFENGFTKDQQLSNWMGLGSTQARFGFASSLGQIQWQSRIGQVDPKASQYGLTHPHGTYGNAPGVPDNPRNYVVDHYFLTGNSESAASGPGYFVIQFQTPVSFIDFAVINYAGETGVSANLTLWNGDSLSNAVEVSNSGRTASIPAGTPSGDIVYLIGNGRAAVDSPYTLPTFNFAVLSMDTSSAEVGFDNFTVGIAPVPEPESYAMLLAGLSLLGFVTRRGKREQIRKSSRDWGQKQMVALPDPVQAALPNFVGQHKVHRSRARQYRPAVGVIKTRFQSGPFGQGAMKGGFGALFH
jgi:hypothetical protein